MDTEIGIIKSIIPSTKGKIPTTTWNTNKTSTKLQIFRIDNTEQEEN